MAPTADYDLWKKHTPDLYDVIITHALDWPVTSAQWLPDHQRILLGIKALDDPEDCLENCVLIVKLAVPADLDAEIPENWVRPPSFFLPCLSCMTQWIKHEGQVNRARYMPQCPTIVAAKGETSRVCIFDTTKHENSGGLPSQVIAETQPEMLLEGHTKGGHGLSWNPFRCGILASGSRDGLVCVWDVGAAGSSSRPIITYPQNTPVGDVTWTSKHENVFSTGDEAGWMRTWDLRDPLNLVVAVRAHLDPLESLAYHPYDEFCLATGSCDNTARIFDIRTLSQPMHTFVGHRDTVVRVDWSPKYQGVLVTSSEDHRVMLWNVQRIGDEQSAEDAEDGPPELVFIHGGHWDIVHDFSWDATANLITSVGEDHTVQIWRTAKHIKRTMRGSSPSRMETPSSP
ncbi:hypothetical protein SELMODRAFT_136329 [Selaginella moellendorffii]|uniref:Histone-binding protein RBBP4-like N-terminal domain-containing protein n=1 Tax=Selaginella moellendorffii TaxID=88036 RepID=D8TBN2_SELML|nr:hypothetical protein SELMODRAFT_136329 [Selaginella moellendorffii]